VRLLLDEMLHKEIAVQLRKRRHDVEAVKEVDELRGLKDVELLRAATSRGRALVTDNVDDYSDLHSSFLGRSEDHAGIVLASSRSLPRSKATIGLWVSALDALLRQDRSPTSMINNCIWLQRAAD
jgi:predicted nuclease of predicted toxin-antitoxin system